MNTISIRRGETHLIDVVIPTAEEASTATLFVKKEISDLSPTIEKSSNFILNKATIELSSADTSIAVGDYLYQITISYLDGSIKKFPDASSCEGECDFPTLRICDSLDGGVVS